MIFWNSIPRFKQRFSIVVPPIDNLFATLDIAKIATTILFVASAINQSNNSPRMEVIDDWGKEIIMSCVAQGLTTPIVALTNIESLPIKVLCFCFICCHIYLFSNEYNFNFMNFIAETSRF